MADMRETVISSLAAVGANHEAKFYADLFAAQQPERFALRVIDPRCLKDPLLEALIGNLRILANLRLTPVLLIGALDDDLTSIKFQAHRLAKDLEQSGTKIRKLDTASYGLLAEIKKITKAYRIPILEITNPNPKFGLQGLAKALQPNKIIFLQPSGGLSNHKKRLRNLTIEDLPNLMGQTIFTPGQTYFLNSVVAMNKGAKYSCSYIIASPLNILTELFTMKGSGTLIRRQITTKSFKSYRQVSKTRLQKSIDSAFGKTLDANFFKRDLLKGVIEKDYRGGAVFTELSGLPYLSKFWVMKEARGEGIASDLWRELCNDIPAFFWRSRMDNSFNDWYMRMCDGMQVGDGWRIFWRGLDAPDIAPAILAAKSEPEDFYKGFK